MKNNIYQKLFLFSFVILAGIAFLGYTIYLSGQKLRNSELRVRHTELVIAKSANIRSISIEIQTASRGYVITNDSTFLEPLHPVKNNVLTYIGQLRQLTRDNPVQQPNIDSLNFYMHKCLNFSYQAIEIRSKEGLPPAIAYIATKQGMRYIDRIRQITGAIEREEEVLLKQRKQVNERSAAVLNEFTVVVFILMTGFTVLLLIAISKYWHQNEEKEKRASELIIANQELAFQNIEKEKRADELIIANKELAFQNEEKEKRASELIIANKELAFQNIEKEKRSDELIVANKELAFQNEEKEKRASELIIANRELVFQNEEKEKHAEELFIAIKGLKNAEDEIRKLNEADIRKLNDELEQKVLERTSELESANKEMESFSYSISHDLRAPLRAVDAYSKIIEESYSDLFDDEGKRLLSVVQRNAKKMGVLIDDLLAFSRLGRKEIHKSSVNMKQLAENVADELNTFMPNKAQIIINNIEPILADSTLMHQVWMNLLSNAIKYSIYTEQPVIEINCEKKPDKIVYSISDNGAGFDMQYAHKLFDVFQRLHAANEFEGTGVGLALVHRIITKHGGEIWANAEIGKGAIFYFSLPKKSNSINN